MLVEVANGGGLDRVDSRVYKMYFVLSPYAKSQICCLSRRLGLILVLPPCLVQVANVPLNLARADARVAAGRRLRQQRT